MPEISVIMCVHDGGKFLAEAVQSICDQTFPDWELILVENGSTDGAVDTLEQKVKDPRIRIRRFSESLQPGGAAEVATELATGRYIAVLDHDDLALPARLEMQKQFLDTQPALVMSGVAVELIDGAGRVIGREPFVGLHEDIHAMLAYVHVLRHSGIMFRRELLEQVRYRRALGAASDWDFFARTSEVGRIGCLPGVLCRYRLHPRNLTVRQAPGTVLAGGLTRLLTRRRRSGLLEDLPRWVKEFETLKADPLTEAEANLAWARVLRAEGYSDLAALHAWLAWRAGGGLRAGARYLALSWAGLRNVPKEFRGALFRAWLKEPTHQLLRAGGMPDRMQF